MASRIRRDYLTITVSHTSIPVVRVWHDGIDITVAFAAFQHLPIFPIKQEHGTIWAALATSGKETLRVWTNEYTTMCELHGIDMSYPRIEERPVPK